MKQKQEKDKGKSKQKNERKTKRSLAGKEKAVSRMLWKRAMWKLLVTVVGALIYAVGVGFFLEPNRLSAGGVAGIALLISQTPIPLGTGIWILILNIPVLLIGMRKFGLRFLGLTILALLISSPLIDLFASFGALTEEPMLAALSGGALMGTGMGLLFRAGSSSGGLDIVTKLLHIKYQHIKSGVIFLVLDAVIILLTMAVFRDINLGLYAAVAILVSSYLMNTVLYGTDEARVVYIVSDSGGDIAQALLQRQNLGATFLSGYGAYTGKEKRVLMCVMRPKQLPYARELVASVDRNAFMIVTGASSVFGEGFKSYTAEEL